ncbi:glutaredoxin [Brucella sp. 10RB9215]|uniref:Glutaredoxin n=1 Tax=Brucella inopinata TaxID=1218315 RepID=A0AAW7AWM7_9HYPH|nr:MULTISPECIES: glutaredoxin 3 [Brucella]EFM56562.1 glutaredoxin 3 [Brucella inopinata BO1]KEY04857.1 glutaredoxin [Brucella suis bv. 4 str. 40]MDL2331375.1 glutaredoxin 3 [Brucella inopinata]SBW14733.1 glutaredoxin [Brucella sp. 10RB9215]
MVDVIIYTRPGCPYCARAKALLARKGAKFNEIDASATPELRAEMQERSGRNTFPQIFIGSVHVGGCDDLYALEDEGKLDSLLKTGKLI